MTLKIRSFTEKDSPSLIQLLNEAHRESYEFIPYTEDNFASWIKERNLTILVAEENGEVVGSISYRSGHWGEEIEWLITHKRPDQWSLESALVNEIEKHVKGETVFTVVDAGSHKISEWLKRGYKLEGGLYHMVARLDGVKPLPKIPEGITMRSLRTGEEQDFVEATNAGFGWKRLEYGVIERWKNEQPLFNEEWIHVAEFENKIISIVVAKPDTEFNEFFGAKRGYLGPAATLPEYRGKNIASALTLRAMNFLYEKGFNSVGLYTSEQNIPSVSLLRKLGFEVGHNWKFMRKNLSHS